jgi:hypothetical protein
MQCEIQKIAAAELQRHGEAVAQIALTPARHLIVDGHHQRLVAAGMRTLDERVREPAIAIDEHLHPQMPSDFAGEIFHRHRRRVAHHVDRIGGQRRARRMRLTARPGHAGEAGGTDQHRHAETLAEQLDGLIALVGAVERPRQDLRAAQRLFVVAHGALVFGAAVDEVEHETRQALLRKLAHCGDAVRFALEQLGSHRAL